MTPPVPILLYHSVGMTGSEAYRPWTVSKERFRRHIDHLAANGYRPVTISMLRAILDAQIPVAPRTIAITFDDGLRDFLTGALPALERHDFPATLFVVAGYVGSVSRWLHPVGEGRRMMLSWPELRSISQGLVECGAHTVSHPQLDLLSSSAASAEIRESKRILEDRLEQSIEAFAYPHGYASPTTRRLVREAGFTSACRVRNALSSAFEDPFAMSRIIVSNNMDENDLDSLISKACLPVAPPSDRLISTGWRLVRRVRKWRERELPGETTGPFR